MRTVYVRGQNGFIVWHMGSLAVLEMGQGGYPEHQCEFHFAIPGRCFVIPKDSSGR